MIHFEIVIIFVTFKIRLNGGGMQDALNRVFGLHTVGPSCIIGFDIYGLASGLVFQCGESYPLLSTA